VLGGIYGGVFTPTEAGAIGALGAILIAWPSGGWAAHLWQVTLETGHITAAICFLIIAATMYSRLLALSGLPAFLTNGSSARSSGSTAFLLLLPGADPAGHDPRQLLDHADHPAAGAADRGGACRST
jgi:C4-dicarboxylate transporter, DctM subunit